METESQFQVLSYLSRGADTSQRKIADGTGLSLAMVNVLLKKMVKKGLVKLERVNGKTLRYILTPSGMTEKTKLTYNYLKASYRQVIKLQLALAEILQQSQTREPYRVVFYGPQDEIREILATAAREQGLQYIGTETAAELSGAELAGSIVITWQLTESVKLPPGIEQKNILEKL